MRQSAIWLYAALAVTVPSAGLASCGSEQCPIDVGRYWEHSRLAFDLSQQYIDQDQPRIGTHHASVGEIPSHEDEIRTVNRITVVRASYQASERWALTASLPFVSRYHEHIHNEEGEAPELQRFRYHGLGDVELQAARLFQAQGEGGGRYHLTAGFKAPTGVRHVQEVDGHEPEPSARPGAGAWGAIAGAGAAWAITAPTPGGAHRSMPVRFGVLARANGRGTERYRIGSELQANVGLSYPAVRSLELLLSGDFRIRGKDDVGDTDAEAGNTGGTWAYVSPGLRVRVMDRTALYGIAQIPVYQRVNGIGLVSDLNLYFGVTQAAF